VYRAIFSIVLNRYQRAEAGSRPSLRGMLLRCDFELAAERNLRPLALRVFRARFVDRGDWRQCCAVLRISRGEFFHEVYWLEERLGRELLRRGIFPLYEYFNWGHEPIIPVKTRQRNAEQSLSFDRRMAPEEYAAFHWHERSDGWDAPAMEVAA
jgi:hypothetical protein